MKQPQPDVSKRKRDIFRFKQFIVKQDKCTHKVGTDGVLLGAWADIKNSNHLLDVGTGSGVIALMLAQRSSSQTLIDAIEPSQIDFEQAKENINSSPWPEKINLHLTTLQEFQNARYDHIISNPPYFINSAKPPNTQRTNARHTESLTHEDLLIHSKRLLNTNGKLSVVLPFIEGELFILKAVQHQLYYTHKCLFKSRNDKPIERLLMEFKLQPGAIKESTLTLYKDAEIWTEAYKELTKDFYLYI